MGYFQVCEGKLISLEPFRTCQVLFCSNGVRSKALITLSLDTLKLPSLGPFDCVALAFCDGQMVTLLFPPHLLFSNV